MLFVIDIGNTHTVAGLCDNEVVVKKWRIKTDSLMTADELAISYHNLLTIAQIDCNAITSVTVSSVVPRLNSPYYNCCLNLFPNLKKEHYCNLGWRDLAPLIDIKLDNPEEVGADRLVNGIAAFHYYKSAAIVIDLGTAITFDCISSQCEYLGGLILPGLQIALQALTEKAAKLPQVDIATPPSQVIGTSTVSAIKSGVVHGYGSMIEGLLGKIIKELAYEKTEVTIVATGGMSTILKPCTPSVQIVEKDLTLKGLAVISKNLGK
ncbi:MAG: type III pantothenate kinase [Desulfobulbaceae bacterium]|nr:MAG: type III pantothenate kinase [Desulfobulbaceae bacterium]